MSGSSSQSGVGQLSLPLTLSNKQLLFSLIALTLATGMAVYTLHVFTCNLATRPLICMMSCCKMPITLFSNNKIFAIIIVLKSQSVHWPTVLFIDPLLFCGGPGNQLLWFEPQINFFVGTFNWVAAMTDVPTNVHTEVSTNSARIGLSLDKKLSVIIKACWSTVLA